MIKKLAFMLCLMIGVTAAEASRGSGGSGAGSGGNNSPDDDSTYDQPFEDLRHRLKTLSGRCVAGPNAYYKSGRRNSLIAHLKNAEKLADRGNHTRAIGILRSLQNRVDGEGADWLKDNPATELNEREEIFNALANLISLIEASRPPTA